jgi:hypothetical protein
MRAISHLLSVRYIYRPVNTQSLSTPIELNRKPSAQFRSLIGASNTFRSSICSCQNGARVTALNCSAPRILCRLTRAVIYNRARNERRERAMPRDSTDRWRFKSSRSLARSLPRDAGARAPRWRCRRPLTRGEAPASTGGGSVTQRVTDEPDVILRALIEPAAGPDDATSRGLVNSASFARFRT